MGARWVWGPLVAAGLIAAAALPASQTASAQEAGETEVLQALSTTDVVTFLEGAGLMARERVEVTKDSRYAGIRALTANNVYFWINLTRCQGEGLSATCKEFQFKACWSGPEQIPQNKFPNPAAVNTFNAQWLFGRVFTQDGGKALCVDQAGLVEGSTRLALKGHLLNWFGVLDNVKKQFAF